MVILSIIIIQYIIYVICKRSVPDVYFDLAYRLKYRFGKKERNDAI